MSNKKEIAKRESSLPAVPQSNWGAGENTDKEDILVPKILVAQGLSEAVIEGDVAIGDLYESIDRNILAKMNKQGGDPLEVIIFQSFKTWQIFESQNVDDPKFEYVTTEPFTPENSGYEWQENINGVLVQRTLVLNFYCILPKEVEENPGGVFPYVLPFKSTSIRAGRKISSRILKLSAMGLPSAAKVFEISRKITEKDGHKYFVMDAKSTRDTFEDEMQSAYKWYTTFKKSVVKVDESDMTKQPIVNDEDGEEPSFDYGANTEF